MGMERPGLGLLLEASQRLEGLFLISRVNTRLK